MQSWKKEEKESANVSLTWYREYIDVKNKEYSDRQLLVPKSRFIIEIEVLERGLYDHIYTQCFSLSVTVHHYCIQMFRIKKGIILLDNEILLYIKVFK